MILSDISLKRPVLAIVTIIALIAIGITSFMGLSLNETPEINIPYVSVSIVLPGASAEQVESEVTKKVEEAVGQISGVKHITSDIKEGLSMTTVEFSDTRKGDDAAQDVRSKLSAIRATFPSDIQEPVISKFDLNAKPIISLAVTGDLSTADMSRLVDDSIVPQLNNISGVGSITTYGLQEREIKIKLDKEKLASFNLTPSQVISGLNSDNFDNPSGKVSNDSREVTLRTYSSINNVEDFYNVIVATYNGTEIRVRDIAEVADGYKDKDSISLYNGKDCIGINIVKQSGSNTVTVTDSIKMELSKLEASLPPGVKIEVVMDDSQSIRSSVTSVEETMIEGCLLAVLIIFLFLRSIGTTAVSAVSLPTAIISTFAAMKVMNFTLNTMSLMALSLSVGLLIDDSIVVIENIVRHLRMGKTPLQAAKEGTSEISLAVIATTLTIVAVFLPMSTMRGMMGAFFKEFGLTIAFAVLISLFVSFTLVPLMASRYVKDEEARTKKTIIGRFLDWFNLQFEILAEYYQKILTLALSHRKKTIFFTLVIFILSLTIIPQMKFSLQPSQDNGTISISAELDSGLPLSVAEAKAKTMEEIITKYPDVKKIYTSVDQNSVNLSLELTEKKARKQSSDQIAQTMRVELQKIPGLDLSVGGSSNSMSSGKGYNLHIKGEDFNQLLEYSQKAKQLLAQIPGAVDVGISYNAGKPETKIVVDRDAAADLGVSPAVVSGTLGILYNGVVAGQYESGNDRVDVRVCLDEDQRENIGSVAGVYVPGSTSGQMIPLDQISKKVYATGSSTISRYDKTREIQVEANYVGMTSGELSSAFMNKLDSELPLPQGLSFSQGSEQAIMQESVASLIQAVLLGILFIFLILAAQFESFMDPLAIMFSLPLAIIGALIALFVTGSGFSMVGGIGIIFLLALVTKNAILLVDFIKESRHKGTERKEAILEAASIRLRPILMTTLAMIFGMIPLAVASGTGAELRQPMAIAIIGGLISSTLLTLLVVPVIYTLLDDCKGLFKKLSKRPLNIPSKESKSL